jgi:Zn-dependent peptidase ImmA (M78 family)
MELNKLYELADSEGIVIDDFPMGTISAQSQMLLDGSCYIALDSRQFHTQADEKVALGHEVGHCLTGSFYNRYSLFDVRTHYERRANKKAAYMLIPLDELIAALESPWGSVFDLAEHFGVTEDFMRKTLEIYENDLRQMSEHVC